MSLGTSNIRRYDFLGLKIDDFTTESLLQLIRHKLDCAESPAFIGNINVHTFNLAFDDPAVRDVVNSMDNVFCDGFGILWAARWLGIPLSERMTPADWIDRLLCICEDSGKSLFLVGDTAEVLNTFQATVLNKYPRIRFAGSHHGFFQHFGAEGQALASSIASLKADVVLVGMGMPLQEKWLHRFKSTLGARVLLPIGGLFRIYSGVQQRPPKWITDNGMEWLARLLINPMPVWRRYIIGNPLFIVRVLRAQLARGVFGNL